MKAVTRQKYGPPEVLEIKEIPKPIPKNHEVLIRVYATTVNRTDCGILTGKPFAIHFFTGLFKPRHLVPGTDFAGEIEAVGKDVKLFKTGDRVWGFRDEGLQSHAQYMTFNENSAIAKIQNELSFDHAVACAEGAHYAYNMIQKVRLNRGDRVLVNGATGAIGSAALQLLKHMGMIVTAVGNTPNIDLIKKLGADKTYDYLKEDFTADRQNYRVIFDSVGKSDFGNCKPLLLSGGVYMSSELGPNAENLYLPLLTKFSDKRVIFPIPKNCKKTVNYMNLLVEEGAFQPVIDKIYPMENIKDAYDYVSSGRKTGNVIIHY